MCSSDLSRTSSHCPARHEVGRRRGCARGRDVEGDETLRPREAAVVQTAVGLVRGALATADEDEADGDVICRLQYCDGTGWQVNDGEVCEHSVGHDSEGRFVVIVRAEAYIQGRN